MLFEYLFRVGYISNYVTYIYTRVDNQLMINDSRKHTQSGNHIIIVITVIRFKTSFHYTKVYNIFFFLRVLYTGITLKSIHCESSRAQECIRFDSSHLGPCLGTTFIKCTPCLWKAQTFLFAMKFFGFDGRQFTSIIKMIDLFKLGGQLGRVHYFDIFGGSVLRSIMSRVKKILRSVVLLLKHT